MEIRYHHLLCLPRFEGKGYSADFCKNMANIKKRYNNEKITLVERCDEICSHCPNNKGGKCKEEEKVKSISDGEKRIENFYDENGIFHCNLIDLLLGRVELF